MNKKVGLIVGIVVIILVGVVVMGTKKTDKPVVNNQTAPTATATPTKKPDLSVSSANDFEAVEGTIKSLVTSGRTIVCTYSRQVNTTTIDGKIYLSDGKMRGDFTSVDSVKKQNVTTHVIINDGKNIYAWTDLINRGVKIAITAKSSAALKSSGFDINETVQFSCQNWTPDASLFVLPSNITF